MIIFESYTEVSNKIQTHFLVFFFVALLCYVNKISNEKYHRCYSAVEKPETFYIMQRVSGSHVN